MHAIVMYSGGIGSWAAGMRAVERYGRANTTLLFCDTKVEDEDLYRFLHEGAEVIGVPVTIIADGRTPWEVFRDVRYLGNSRVAPCTRILKQEVAERWVRERYQPHECIRLLGMDFCQREQNRLKDAQAKCAPYQVDSPLFWAPALDKDAAKLLAIKHGLHLSRLYELGFQHDNCGGACVRAGQANWALLYRTLPARFAQNASEETALGVYLGKPVTILKDRRGGVTKPLPLAEFGERLATDQLSFDDDWQSCQCFV